MRIPEPESDMSDDEQAPSPIEETQVVNLLFLHIMSEYGFFLNKKFVRKNTLYKALDTN